MELLFERKNIKRAAAIHFTTEEEMSQAKPYTFGTPAVVIPHGLYLADYENLPEEGVFRARYPETKDKHIILFLGRINFVKGLDILVQAFAMASQSRDDIHLVIAGPDNEGFGHKVRAWLKGKRVLHHVTFTGMLERKDKLAALRDAEMFILPSYSENFGVSVVEAMASGTPVLISDKVKIWREVEVSGAGKVAPCDARRFARMILDVLDDPKEARDMGKRGKAMVKERYRWSSVAAAMEAAYHSILSEGTAKASSSQAVQRI